MQCINTLTSTFCLVQASAENALYHHLAIHFLLGTSKCSKCIVSQPYHPLFAWYKQVQEVHCITTLPSTFCLVQASATSVLYHHSTIHFLLGTSKCSKCIVSPPYHLLSAANALYQYPTIYFLLGTSKCSKCNVSPPYHPLFARYKQVQQVHCFTILSSTFCLVQASAASTLYQYPTIYLLLGIRNCSKCIVSPPYHPLFCLVQASAMYHHLTILFFDWYKQVQMYHHLTIHFLLGTSESSKCIVSPPYHPLFAWYKQVQCINTLPSTFCLVEASAAYALYHHLTIYFLLGTSKCSKCIVSPPYHPLFAWHKQVQQVNCITVLPSTFCLVQASATSALYHHPTVHFLLGTSKCSKCIVSPPYPLLSAANALYHYPTIYFLLGTSKCNVSPPYYPLFARYKQVQQVHCITALPSTFCLVQASAASTLYRYPTIYFLLGTRKCSKCIVSPPYHPLFAWYK